MYIYIYIYIGEKRIKTLKTVKSFTLKGDLQSLSVKLELQFLTFFILFILYFAVCIHASTWEARPGRKTTNALKYTAQPGGWRV